VDVEQPTPADATPDSTFEGIEEPDEVIENAAYITAAHEGCETGTYYSALIAMDVPPKHAYWLTSQWLAERV
jgi:hypothetical protein